MLWNPLVEVTALLMIILFIIFYNIQKFLPTKKNKVFSRMMQIELVSIVSDLIASWSSSYFTEYPVWFLQLTNTVYFLSISFVIYNFYVYCRAIVIEARKTYKADYFILKVPMIVMALLLIINPFTSWIFSVDNTVGYARQFLHPIFLVPFCIFYLILGLFYIIYFGKYVSIKEKVCIYVFAFFALSAVVAQGYFFPYLLLINNAITTGMAIIFLAIQSPVFGTNSKTKLFSQNSFLKYVGELIKSKRKLKIIAFSFSNYNYISSIYGSASVNDFLRRVGAYLRNKIKSPTFYLHDGKFGNVLNSAVEEESTIKKLNEVFSVPWKIGSENVKMRIKIVKFSKNIKLDDENLILNIILQALEDSINFKNQDVQNIEESLVEKVKQKQNIRQILHEAINKDSLEIYYQPIFDNKENKINSAEALVRMFDKNLGLIPPDKFISMAEEDETILHLGMQVFRKVCAFIKKYNLDDLGLKYIEVNLSPIQCMYKGIAKELIKTAKEFGVDLKYINFEITESFVVNIDDVKKIMTELIEEGASFSLDDYGTGFSNLIRVLSLPLKIIKIDKSIVSGFFAKNNEVLSKVLNMFEAEGFEVLAEGIETEQMKKDLTKMNCRYIQGYYYSRPIPENQFVEYMKSHNAKV